MSFDLSVFPNTPNLHKIVLHEIDRHLDIYDTIKIVIIVWFQFTPQTSRTTGHQHQRSLECSSRPRACAPTVKPEIRNILGNLKREMSQSECGHSFVILRDVTTIAGAAPDKA